MISYLQALNPPFFPLTLKTLPPFVPITTTTVTTTATNTTAKMIKKKKDNSSTVGPFLQHP